ncbi:MFS general substrate transporter [Moniliophthora roreri MCA 2997]|uniref:MFS general substrate transporter n=1 Tax=Moniliophthora roreri (strain MCA 2997) TaxID=1381753 RepID=V2XK23_MONRO|nr:MFS general substrate transporter [Moniliophthora roreri MCA 2997]KAI3598506.1 MFS general substrate transporter [Moniliophthora roreri]
MADSPRHSSSSDEKNSNSQPPSPDTYTADEKHPSSTSFCQSPSTLAINRLGRDYVADEHHLENGPSNPTPPQITFPEGGWQAWLTVLGGWMVIFCTAGSMQSFGVYQNYYTLVSLTDHPPSDISWIGSLQACLMFGGGIFSGKMFDLGLFKHMLAGGSLLFVFSQFMLSLVKPHHFYQNFLAQGVGMGLSMGILFMPTLSIASHYFKRKRALAMGIMLSGGSLGAAIYPILLNPLFNGKVGFAWGVRAAAFLNLGFLIIANITMKTRLPPRPSSAPIDMKGIVTDVPYLICNAGSFFVFWGLFVPYFYLQLFAAKHGMSEGVVTYGITVLNIVGIFGRTVPNLFADMWGPFNVIITMAVITGSVVFALLGATSGSGLIPFAVIYGFTSGGFVSVLGPVAATFARDINEVGTRMGLVTFVFSFAMLTGSPISGVLLHPPEYTWYRPVVFSGVTVLSGAALLAVSRSMQAKKKQTWRV